jgi:hypothetical protein
VLRGFQTAVNFDLDARQAPLIGFRRLRISPGLQAIARLEIRVVCTFPPGLDFRCQHCCHADPMAEFRFLENPDLPRLAWCAKVARSSRTVIVEHGPWVEAAPRFFVEGAWNGSFGRSDLGAAEVVLGSGGSLHGGRVAFTPTTHTMERLHSLRLHDELFVSNSLSYLLEATGSKLNRKDWSYESDLMTFLRGYKRATQVLRLEDRRILRLHYHQTVLVDEQLSLATADPPQPPSFTTYRHYVDYLLSTLAALRDNAADRGRRVTYEPLTTISSGYDSPACAVLAKHVGCRRSVTFESARQAFEPPLQSTDDSGAAIATLLGLAVESFSRDAYLASRDYPEVPFIATGNGGDDAVLSAIGSGLERTMLFTGMLGDTLWGTSGQDPKVSKDYRFRYPAGGSLQEFRLKTGFVHVPVPLLTFTRHLELQAISRSMEMAPWRLGIQYDRPIPRRLVEEAGVPRDAFAQEKRAITQPFWLQKANPSCMSAQSLEDFRKFVADRANEYPFGGLQMKAQTVARKAYYRMRKKMRRLSRPDPYFSYAYEAAATTEPLRFHWAVEKLRAAYRATAMRAAG